MLRGIPVHKPDSITSGSQSNLQTINSTVESKTDGHLVCIYTLGRFAIQQMNMQTSTPSSARQQKPQELLQAMVALGGRNISNESLCHTLWPDAEGDSASNSLDVNVHRLRKFLGNKQVVIATGGRLTLNNELVWVDVWAFERLLNQVDKLLISPDAFKSIDSINKIFSASLNLYQGAFLIHEPHKPWNLPLRERLRSKMLRHTEDIGRLHEQHQNWNTAIRYYQRGIEIDALAEELYQHIMICLRQLNRQAEALAIYQRCRTSLAEGLDVTPSPLTEKIRNTLY